MTITLDTSIFVEVILGQEKAEESQSLLNLVATGGVNAVVSHFSIHAIGAIIRSQAKLSEFLKAVELSTGLTVYDTTLTDEQTIAILSAKIKLDLDDSVQYFVAKRTNSTSIVSFDRHFDGLDVPRREPFQILEDLRTRSKNGHRRR